MNIFNKITNIINNFLDYDIDDLVCFIISQEALPNPLSDDDENRYVSVFNYSEKYGGALDSFKYYNDYVIELGGRLDYE